MTNLLWPASQVDGTTFLKPTTPTNTAPAETHVQSKVQEEAIIKELVRLVIFLQCFICLVGPSYTSWCHELAGSPAFSSVVVSAAHSQHGSFLRLLSHFRKPEAMSMSCQRTNIPNITCCNVSVTGALNISRNFLSAPSSSDTCGLGFQ